MVSFDIYISDIQSLLITYFAIRVFVELADEIRFEISVFEDYILVVFVYFALKRGDVIEFGTKKGYIRCDLFLYEPLLYFWDGTTM